MLYKTAEHFNLPPDQAFSDIKSNPAYSHASKDSQGTWVVPTRGDLAVTFSIDKAVTEAMKDIEDFDFNHVIERHEEITRVRPAPTKVVPLLAAWKRIEGRSNEQMVFLNALSQDFLLSYEHIYQMVTSRTMLVDIIEKLLPCLPEGPVSRYLSLRLVPSLGELLQLQQRQRHFLSFNVDNPNGRYKLDLESASDHAVAERMVLLDRWEAGVARKLKRVDTSQLGNFSQIRNVCFQHQRRKQGIQEWRMPETGILEYDYSTGQRPPSTAKQLDDQTYSNILVGLHSSECGTQDQLLSLQAISHQVYITAMQMRGFLGIYKEKSARWSLFVLWLPRIMDWHNEKVFRVAFEDDSELCELRDRLGWVTLFPFIQPEQAVFNLDFAFFEQRTVASLVMYLSKQESVGNVRDVKYIHEDGFADPLTAGIPQSWDDASKLPKGGTLHVSYVCAPEDRAFQVRKTLCEKYCYRKLDVSEDDVMWWAALTEAPRDVLTYLQWILSKFSTPKVCFKEIDGPGGNGVISLREFEEGWKEMNCQIFKGADERKRINDIFRWLDPSGEGQVSEGEFSIMDALAKEIKQSVTEFVQFAMRTFGPELKDTWHFMDEDGGGEIDLQEWCNACQELGYFGPTEPIFRYLDADNEGTVSLDEFMKLDDFKTQEPQKCKERMSTITPADRLERFRQTSASADEASSSSVTSSRATSQSGSRPGSSHRKSLKHKT
jgi:Ca2+-binding EF-hand superfamily protein